MKKKIKLRDLTKKEYRMNREQICEKYNSCSECPFGKVKCSENDPLLWQNHKDLFSDKFLDQEIEIDIDILTDDDKHYLKELIESLTENNIQVVNIRKYADITDSNIDCLYFCTKGTAGNIIKSFRKGTMFNDMPYNRIFQIKDLDLEENN